jgi:hypothetical protein
MAPAFTVPIDGWHQYTLNMLAQGPGTKARFAIQYAGAVDGMNYVGLDTLVVATSDAPPPAVVPEPATAFVLGSGLVGMLAARRRRQQRAA